MTKYPEHGTKVIQENGVVKLSKGTGHVIRAKGNNQETLESKTDVAKGDRIYWSSGSEWDFTPKE